MIDLDDFDRQLMAALIADATASARALGDRFGYSQPAAWRRIAGSEAMSETFELGGSALKRPPRGFDPEHPLIEDIKRTDFIAVSRLRQGETTASGFLDHFADLCRQGTPLVRFLCRAVDVPV